MELFKTVPEYFMAICLSIYTLRFRYNSIKPIKIMSRRHHSNFSDLIKVLGQTIVILQNL